MRPKSLLIAAFLLIAAAGLAPGLGHATDTAPPDPAAAELTGTQRLGALIERVRYENSRLETLEADFTLHKESSLLVAPEESRGVFSYAAPDRVRWEYTSPNPISLLIEGDEMTTWYRDVGQAEKVEIGRRSQQVLKYLGASSSLETLLEYFTVTLRVSRAAADPYQLELSPRFARVAKRVQSMSVWIDRQRFLPVRLRYVEPDGDITEYSFANFRVNALIPAERFELHIPQGVDVRVLALDNRAGAR